MNNDAVQIQKSNESADTTEVQLTGVEKVIISDKNNVETTETDAKKAGKHLKNHKHKLATEVEEDVTSKNTESYVVMDHNASAKNQETNLRQTEGEITMVQTNNIGELQPQDEVKKTEKTLVTEEKNVLPQGKSMIMTEDCNLPMPVAEEKAYVKDESAFFCNAENITEAEPIYVVNSDMIDIFDTYHGYKKPAIASEQNDHNLHHADKLRKSEVNAYDQALPLPEQYDEREISAMESFYSESMENLDSQKDFYNIREGNAQGLQTIAENENETMTDSGQLGDLKQESAKAISSLTLNEESSVMMEFEKTVYAEFCKRMKESLKNGELLPIKNYADALRSEFISDNAKVQLVTDIEKQIYALISDEITNNK